MIQSPEIEVGIMAGERETFRLAGKYRINDGMDYLYNFCDAEAEGEYIVLRNCGKSFRYRDELVLVPSRLSADYFELSSVTIGIDFHWETRQTQKFQGSLKLKIREGRILFINLISAENYLYSVISSEMNANSSLQLLKAHAIISRSWLMARLFEKRQKAVTGEVSGGETEIVRWFDTSDHEDFHICADDHCQRYQGISNNLNANVIRAVNETQGMVLMHKGTVCDTRYSKSCGGHTELYENCWDDQSHSYLRGFPDKLKNAKESPDLREETQARKFILSKPDSLCNTSDETILSQVLNDYDLNTPDFYRWKVEYSQESLAALIMEKSGMDFGGIIALEPVQRGVSGRLVKLRIRGTKKEVVIGKELLIRRWLSKSHLYSSAIVIDTGGEKDGLPSRFIIHGAGWGHGVGLCQIGAAVMGERNMDFRDILAHYYRGADIERYYY